MPDNFKNPIELSNELIEQSSSPIEQWRNLISNHPRQKGSISDWSKAYQGGAFNDPDVKTQIEAGWYDWWGPDKNLVKGKYTDIGEFHLPKDLENFIEKVRNVVNRKCNHRFCTSKQWIFV